jgi:hypothetical protein
MNRNQKIALGCGGAGCLGLIVVAIACVLIYFFANRRTYSTNRRYNSNVTTLGNANANDNANTNDNDNSSRTSPGAASSMSDDDKHKLYQAALQSGDAELLRRVEVKLGLREDDYTAGEKYQAFVIEHVTWAYRNTDFGQSINTPEKARAYVNQNFPD